ncbi:MAG: hypothetical protein DMF79_19290 [Acidobacteria bacterium]|nr:MAG: hypothetical protein DMF79_19290 [Acidobacteriota bacterium]
MSFEHDELPRGGRGGSAGDSSRPLRRPGGLPPTRRQVRGLHLQPRLPYDRKPRGRGGPGPGGLPSGLRPAPGLPDRLAVPPLDLHDRAESLSQPSPATVASAVAAGPSGPRRGPCAGGRDLRPIAGPGAGAARPGGGGASIDALPPKYREVFVLRQSQELSYEEIAGLLGLPLGTVEVRLFRARRLLLKGLQASHLKQGTGRTK